VLATGVTTVGNYADLTACQAELAQFHKQNITAACVQQPSAEQSMAQAQAMLKNFMKIMEQK
jgi:disulfide oxidoreductase YuzD